MSLLHIATAAGIASRDGRHFRPHLVSGFRDLADGHEQRYEAPHPLQVIPVRISRYIKTVRRGTAASLRRMLDKDLWSECGGKTGTGETTKRIAGTEDDPVGSGKPATQDHKLFTGFWPASSRSPFVVSVAFEHASPYDERVAIRTFGRIVQALAEQP